MMMMRKRVVARLGTNRDTAVDWSTTWDIPQQPHYCHHTIASLWCGWLRWRWFDDFRHTTAASLLHSYHHITSLWWWWWRWRCNGLTTYQISLIINHLTITATTSTSLLAAEASHCVANTASQNMVSHSMLSNSEGLEPVSNIPASWVA